MKNMTLTLNDPEGHSDNIFYCVNICETVHDNHKITIIVELELIHVLSNQGYDSNVEITQVKP